MRVVIASDEPAPLVEAARMAALECGFEVDVCGANLVWPEVGRTVGEAVAAGKADFGIVCCWTGTGVSIAANKVRGVRAALCGDAETARGARRWNDANVLALSIRATSQAVGDEIVRAFLTGRPEPDQASQIAAVE